MGRILLLLVAMPIVCGPVSYLVGLVWKKARDIFVQSAAALELLLVLSMAMGEDTAVRVGRLLWARHLLCFRWVPLAYGHADCYGVVGGDHPV